MKKNYLTTKWIVCLLVLFNLAFQKAESQTCTSLNSSDCTIAIGGTVADPCANFTGNTLTSVTNSGLSFTGTPTSATTKLSLTSRTYTVQGSSGCVVVSFTEASTTTITSTDVTLTTNTGANITCTGVTVTAGQVCVRICDSRITDGTLLKAKIDFNSTSGFTSGQTVTLSALTVVGVAACTPVTISCPTTYVSLTNDCGTTCNAAYPVSAGKIRVFFNTPIPVGQPTPVITNVSGVGITAGQYIFCLNSDAGTTVQRSYADYCVYTTIANITPIFPTTGNLTLTFLSGTLSTVCNLSVCLDGTYAVLNNTTGCPTTACSGSGTLSGKVRVFFKNPIPIGTPTPIITSETVGGVPLLGYTLCLNADAGTSVVRTYADYCIYTDLLVTTAPFPTNLAITFNLSTGGSICTTPIPPPCSSGFLVLNTGTGTGGPVCPAVPSSCNQTFVVVSRLRVYFTPCLPAGLPAPSITGAQGFNSAGAPITLLTNRFCFVASAESNQLISTVRCYIDYCVYGQAGDTYFNTPDAQLQFTFTYDILTTLNGIQTPLTQTCSPTPGPVGPIYNPDVNVTTVNVPVNGNVSTNDVVPSGTTYGTPQPSGSNPAGATITLNSNGTYIFNAIVAGVYIYRVPVCVSGAVPPCPTTELRITVTNIGSTINPPVANTDLAATKTNTAVTIKILANDKCSNPGCTLNVGSVTILVPPTHALGPVVINADGTITYTPATNYTGPDSLTYQVCDNANLCTTAKVYITVSSGSSNSTMAADDYVKTTQGVAVTGNVKTNDTDPQGDAQVVTPQNVTTTQGTLVLNADGTFTFTPAGSFTGPVSFVYTTCDNGTPTACANATLYILVAAANTPDLTPRINLNPNNIIGPSTMEITVQINELNDMPTNGSVITLYVDKLSSFSGFNFNPSQTTNSAGQSVQNSQFNVDATSQPNYYVITTNAIIQNGAIRVAFTVYENPSQTKGSTPVSVYLVDGSGGETNFTNNTSSTTLTFSF